MNGVFDGSAPVFEQVAEYWRKAILDGTIRDGEQLPATTQFAAAHRINPGTVTKGLALLTNDGLIEKRRGIGMFVAVGARDRLAESMRRDFIDDVFAPAVRQGRLLGVSEDELLACIRAELGGVKA